MSERIPAIVTNLADVLEGAHCASDPAVLGELRAFAASIARDDPLEPLFLDEAPEWEELFEQQCSLDRDLARSSEEFAELSKCSWMTLPWWFVENWLYHVIRGMTKDRLLFSDPFRIHKRQANEAAIPSLEGQIHDLASCGEE